MAKRKQESLVPIDPHLAKLMKEEGLERRTRHEDPAVEKALRERLVDYGGPIDEAAGERAVKLDD